MADRKARLARRRAPEPITGLKEEPRAVGEEQAYEPPSRPALTSRLGPAAEASYGPPFVAGKAERVVKTRADIPTVDVQAVIGGTDERVQVPDTTVYPYSAIADLSMRFKDGWYQGTAWFIGPYTLMTAGHNVYAADPNHPSWGWATGIEVMPGRNGGDFPFGSIMAYDWDAAYWWKNGGYQDYDYGVIVVNEPLGNTVDRFGFHAMSDDKLLAKSATVCGYPYDKDGGTTMWFDEKPVSGVDALNVYYETDTEYAQSGSPVFYEEGGRSYAFAVHNYSGETANSGRRITDTLFEWMKKWKYDPFGRTT
jgi:glutamyl endopeptidase